MAWNGSDGVKGKRTGGQMSDRSRRFSHPTSCTSLRRGALAGLIIVALGCGAIWWFVGGHGTTRPTALSTKHQDPGTISKVKPQIVMNAVEEDVDEEEVVATKPEGPDPNARPTKVGEKVNGYIMMPSGEIHKMTGTPHSVGFGTDASQIFDNPAENEIASLLTMEPGEVLVGGPDKEFFTEEFVKSTTVPIIVKTDDPDDVKELKRAVNQVKIELKNAYDRGEDIGEIIAKTYDDFQRLEQYKSELSCEVQDYSEKDEVTDQDIKDYVKAANMMLEKKGIAPLDDNEFIRAKVEYDLNTERND